MGWIIGIDLGTTNSVVAVMDGREPRVLVNEEGQRVTPSVVSFDERGQAVVGAVARRQAITNADRTVYSVKRLMGQRHADVSGWSNRLGYRVVAGAQGEAVVEIDGRAWTPEELSARVLMKLRRAAEATLGESVEAAVITVPAYFTDAQRQATRTAGQIAGLEVRRIINEPTAAALAWGVQERGDGRIAVFDFGGGTFDISLLEVQSGVVEVLATAGDTHLGGDDIDLRIQDWLLGEFREQTGIDASGDKLVAQRLRDAAERAKIELSTTAATEVHLPFLAADAQGPRHLKTRLTRARLETMISDLVGRTIACCERVLEDAGLKPADIGTVLLVGGSTRIPIVHERVRAFFGREPDRSVNPDEAVALGAAVQGAILGGDHQDLVLLDVTPLSLGVETRGGLFTRILERNTTIPTRAQRTFATAADQQRTVRIRVLQGEHEFSSKNRPLGEFELTDIPPMPRGQARVEVTFDIDANGMVSVSAREVSTGVQTGIRITDAGGIEASDVERMIAEAAQDEENARERRRGVERANQLESTLLRLEDRLVQTRATLTEGLVAEVESSIRAARDGLRAEGLGEEDYLRLNGALLSSAVRLEDEVLGAAARARHPDQGTSSR